MMHVMVSHAGSVQADCAAALRAYAPEAEYVDTSGDDQTYARKIAEHWTGQDDLVIIEHDNEITDGVLPSFAACPEPWCVYEYEIFPPPLTRLCVALGCVRFSAGLQREFSFRAEILGLCENCGGTHAHWGQIDVLLASALSNRLHLEPHVHGTIRHFHPYQALEPDADGEFRALDVNISHVKGGFRRVTG